MWYQDPAYHQLLNSREREAVFKNNLYDQLISLAKFSSNIPMNILDFGCGQGHIALYLAEQLQNFPDTHIYCCDYTEEDLDLIYLNKITNQLHYITPFFMPDHSKLRFASWLPKMDHILCAFSISRAQYVTNLVTSMKSILNDDGALHIIDWEISSLNDTGLSDHIKNLLQKNVVLTSDKLGDILQANHYIIHKKYKPSKNCYAITAKLQ